MSAWSRWYTVVKTVRGHRYLYDQSTRRMAGFTLTRNRYLGPVDGPARRRSLVDHTPAAGVGVRPGDWRAGDAHGKIGAMTHAQLHGAALLAHVAERVAALGLGDKWATARGLARDGLSVEDIDAMMRGAFSQSWLIGHGSFSGLPHFPSLSFVDL